MKTQVLEVLTNVSLKPHEKFNQAMKLLARTKENNPMALRTYNQKGYTPQTLEAITYDLQQLHRISNKELRKKFVPAEKEEKIIVVGTGESGNAAALLALNIEQANYHSELKPLAASLAEELKIELRDFKKDTLIDFLTEEKENLLNDQNSIKENPFTEAGDDEKAGLKIRVEFPFLKEENCPDEMKVLVSDKITAFQKVLEARAELFKHKDGQAFSEEEILEHCKSAVENFQLNQEIYDELNHFKEEKEILGKHPIFSELMLKKEIEAMTGAEAQKEKTNLASRISKTKKKAENAKTKDTKEPFLAELKELEHKRNLVQAKLDKTKNEK